MILGGRDPSEYNKYSSIFRGRDATNNFEIIEALSAGEATIWELTNRILEKKMRKPPRYNDVRQKYPVFYRLIKGRLRKSGKTLGLCDKGYVEVRGTRTSKGKPNPLYGLTLRAVLIALLINSEEKNVLKFLERHSAKCQFFAIAKSLLENGVSEEFVRDLFLGSIKESIKKGLLNVDVAEEDILGDSVRLSIDTRYAKMASQYNTKVFKIVYETLERLSGHETPVNLADVLHWAVICSKGEFASSSQVTPHRREVVVNWSKMPKSLRERARYAYLLYKLIHNLIGKEEVLYLLK